MYENRTLVRGDNLEEMRKFPDDCIDLIATDPPFNIVVAIGIPAWRGKRDRDQERKIEELTREIETLKQIVNP